MAIKKLTSEYNHPKYQEQIRMLNEISSDFKLSFEQVLQKGIQVGLNYFGLELGILSRIINDDYIVESSSDSKGDTVINQSTRFSLGKTYCSITLQQKEEVVITHMGKSKYSKHPCYEEFKLESYIGIPIFLNEEIYGTLNFSSPESKKDELDDQDKEFLIVAARWISSILNKRNEHNRLVSRNALLSAIFSESPNAFVFADPNRVVQEVNPVFEKMFGYKREEFVGKLTRMIYANEPDFSVATQKRFNPEIKRKDLDPYRVSYRRKNGEEFIGETVGYPVRDNDNSLLGYVGIIRDISEELAVEKLLSEQKVKTEQASRLTSLGQMASGIAHELNSPLAAIHLCAEVIQMRSESLGVNDSQISECSEKILELIEQISNLTNLMKSLGSKSYMEKREQTDIAELVKSTCSIFKEVALDLNISLELKIDEGLPKVLLNPQELSHILINLLNNSIDSFEESSSNNKIVIKINNIKNAVVLTLIDNGMGMDEKTKENILVPFYTTKEPSKGMGLGLSLVQTLCTNNDIDLSFDSKLDKGTEFVLTFKADA